MSVTTHPAWIEAYHCDFPGCRAERQRTKSDDRATWDALEAAADTRHGWARITVNAEDDTKLDLCRAHAHLTDTIRMVKALEART
jgi:hypothetical protein